MTRGDSDWEGVRLHIVTGKGGTGKTTVAGALALALAASGQTVLLCEVEGRQGIARLFDAPNRTYDEHRIAAVPDENATAGEVYGLAIDPEAALAEYLEMYYHMGRAVRALDKVGAIDFATTIAPGVRDVLLTGKVYEAVRRKEKKRTHARVYDAVVLDAPPTGRIARFLGVNAGVADIARVGPIRRQADSIMTMMRSPQTVVHLVTLLEEMPVQETADGIAELREAKIPVGAVVVNLAEQSPLDAKALTAASGGSLPRDDFTAALRETGLSADDETVNGLLTDAREHAVRVELENELRAQVAGLGRPTYELPRLTDGVDLGALFELSHALTAQGMA
ncbi:ArsA-related P-loop ATPase [Actinopolymorpha singaporensis]|uniref:Anion-transporting ATPase, ArsA/GET3 family n=1 Tax=Actinopolymorpha singaporensis TaxID=117157 RepID=A0A1H1PZH5_9ACTN|nr:ArsA-related P-loop ATPase [Actinopolymorpha singaporensis]SDS16503.1 Anion-transporting ATPase, ArsA/GET3 family [Actinopolymorpha singaporensis]